MFFHNKNVLFDFNAVGFAEIGSEAFKKMKELFDGYLVKKLLHFFKSQTIIGNRRTTIEIIIPGGERYGLYAGSPLSLLFLTSEENQLPRIMAAVKMAIILTRVIKFSKNLFPIYSKIFSSGASASSASFS